jgi:hypothetical protein
MRRRTSFCLFAAAPILAGLWPDISWSQSNKIEVRFISYTRQDWIHTAILHTADDVPDSQIVIVVRTNNSFSIPLDGNRRPTVALRDRPLANPRSYEWKVIVELRPAPTEVYAIVCLPVTDRTSSFDPVDSLRHLRLTSAPDIPAVLRILFGFGWRPVGYTSISPPQ